MDIVVGRTILCIDIDTCINGLVQNWVISPMIVQQLIPKGLVMLALWGLGFSNQAKI